MVRRFCANSQPHTVEIRIVLMLILAVALINVAASAHTRRLPFRPIAAEMSTSM